MIWVQVLEGIAGNEKADLLARTGSEPACGISIGFAKRAVRDWTNRNHKNQWESTTGLKQAKRLVSGPSARRTKDLLKLNRNYLQDIVSKGTPFQTGIDG
jgi:hypothetical protein